jgi:hypothetical protein
VLFSWLADLAVLLHALFILFVVGGGFLVLRWPRLAWLQLPAALWGGVVELTSGLCPLTDLELYWRRLGGESGYSGSFIEHYLEPLIYPAGLTVRLQIAMGVGVLLLNGAIYLTLWRRRSRHVE